ncbi:STE/STE7 protein kinase [Mycena olivaceomarginata]|nr:STE/STE7 protein kinase [Mycena olivaceomarginata]
MSPRTISSPSPAALSPGTTPPLAICKPQHPSLRLPSLTSPAPSPPRSPSPDLSLSIPAPALVQPPPKPKISLAIPSGSGQSHFKDGGGDSPQRGYYGGPVNSAVKLQTLDNLVKKLTIRPDSTAPAKEPASNNFLTSIKTRPPSSDSPLLPTQRRMLFLGLPASSTPSGATMCSRKFVASAKALVAPSIRSRISTVARIIARKTISTREAPMKQLLRELSILSSIEHINIALFYGAYMSSSSSEVKILTEFCEGGSLEAIGKRIKERNAFIGENIAGRLAEGVLQGLAYLHTKQTIHRNIKPSHILLSREGIVKICDFGVSGELIESQAGTFTGTSSYMAPERIVGQRYTIRSDVWSTGISLLELVQNRFPFPNDLPPIELMMHITAGEPPQLEDEPGLTWSDDLKDFIKQTLTVDAMARPTPKDMLAHPWVSTS